MDWIANCKLKKNDVIFTPLKVVKKLIPMMPFEVNDRVLDAWAGDKIFYNHYPSSIVKDWCEIRDGRDFLDYEETDWICSNPPYSKLKTHFPHILKICKKGFGLLIGYMNLSTAKMAMLNKAGFHITHIHYLNIVGFGMTMSIFIICEKIDKGNKLSYDNTRYQMDGDQGKNFKKKMKAYQAKYYKDIEKARRAAKKK